MESGDGETRIEAGEHPAMKAAVGLIQLHRLGFDEQASAMRHGVSSIKAKVDENLLDLRRVGVNGF